MATTLPDAAYSKVSLPTLGKDVILASTGTAFGEYARTRTYVVASGFWLGFAKTRTYAISIDTLLKVSLPTLGKDIILRIPGIPEGIGDSLSWSDALRLGIGMIIPETLTFSDSLGTGFNNHISLSDTINNWSEAPVIGHGLILSDTQTLSDSLLLQSGFVVSDTFTLTDAQTYSLQTTQALLTDTLTLTDGVLLSSGGAFNVADDLNNWAEAKNFGLSLRATVTDAITWTDAAARATNINVVALSRSVSDFWANRKNGVGWWRDARAIRRSGEEIILVADDIVDPDDQFIIDAQGIPDPLGLASDQLVLDDAERITLGFAVNPTDAFDTMQYNWDDTVSVSHPASFGQSFAGDSLNFWADAIIIQKPAASKPSADKLIFGDAIVLRMDCFLAATDVFHLSDGFGNEVWRLVADTLVLTDHLDYQYNSENPFSFSDAMNMLDGFSWELIDAVAIDYYRRYLGDVYKQWT